MSRSHVLTFLAGVCVASFVAWSSPAPATTKYKYKVIDPEIMQRQIEDAVSKRATELRLKYASDAEAMTAALEECRLAWLGNQAAQGWLPLGRWSIQTTLPRNAAGSGLADYMVMMSEDPPQQLAASPFDVAALGRQLSEADQKLFDQARKEAREHGHADDDVTVRTYQSLDSEWKERRSKRFAEVFEESLNAAGARGVRLGMLRSNLGEFDLAFGVAPRR